MLLSSSSSIFPKFHQPEQALHLREVRATLIAVNFTTVLSTYLISPGGAVSKSILNELSLGAQTRSLHPWTPEKAAEVTARRRARLCLQGTRNDSRKKNSLEERGERALPWQRSFRLVFEQMVRTLVLLSCHTIGKYWRDAGVRQRHQMPAIQLEYWSHVLFNGQSGSSGWTSWWH